MSVEPVTSLDLDKQLAAAGPISGLFRELADKFFDQPHIPSDLMELVRLDLAYMHRSDAEMAARRPEGRALSKGKIDAVLTGNWHRDSQFSEAERAVLNFAEYYFVDPETIPDQAAFAVSRHFGDSGLVCLIEALGFIDARIRLALIYSTKEA
jgi:alkylhydroperoxidase family enzyme